MITQVPLVEKIITPYILLLVTTPMIALVPLLILVFGFTLTPRIIAVALASGPMVMINAATGFRRTDLAKIALARSYGASTLQIFTKIRFPLALPMIIVGLMVGAIFGMLTAVGAEMVGGKNGLGNQLMFWSSMVKMDKLLCHHPAPGADGRLHLRHLLLDRQEVGRLAGVTSRQSEQERQDRLDSDSRLPTPDSREQEMHCFLTRAGSVAWARGSTGRSGIDGAGFARRI